MRHAIVRKPGRSFAEGITTANKGKPCIETAIKQHRQYVEALESLGIEVLVLEADERFPDSTFVEDTAIVNERCAIITRPGAQTRRGEELEILPVLQRFYQKIEYLQGEASLDGGDVLRVKNHFFIGLTQRTNKEGARQLTDILGAYGYTASTIEVEEVLHLKTGVVYLDKGIILATGEFLKTKAFSSYRVLEVVEEEAYAVNCIVVRDTLLIPKGFPKTRDMLQKEGFRTLEVEMGEFEKMDGGLTCLSLRIP